ETRLKEGIVRLQPQEEPLRSELLSGKTEEGGRQKCGQYWPLEEGGQEVYGHMAVVNQRVDHHPHYNHISLELHNTERQLSHFQYLSWPDYGVPTSAVTLIDFLGAVKRQQKAVVKGLGSQWSGHPLGPPMVVHCSAGIGRTGELSPLGPGPLWGARIFSIQS
ncbi:hypothetical protein CRUP_012362, partial [Coryphaenoides rupestris]